jgi:hypothetical protein
MPTCVVGCKLPNGLQVRLGEKHESVGEGRDAQLVVSGGGKALHLKGSQHRDADGIPIAIGGFGFTPGVDADLMSAWLDQHKDFAPVKAGMIFVEKDMASAKAKAREMAGETNGFERLDPEDPLGDGTIEPTDEMKAELAKNKA